MAADNVYGGPQTVNATNFGDGGNQLFTTPPGCLFHHQASFITDFFNKQGHAQPGDYDFFPFPDINTAVHRRDRGRRRPVRHVQRHARSPRRSSSTSSRPQPSRSGSCAAARFPAARASRLDAYPDDFSKRSAEALNAAKSFVFDASDLMSTSLGTAFLKGIVDFTQDQTKLDSILTNLDTVQGGG